MAQRKLSSSMSIVLIVTLVISFMESGLTLNCYICDSRESDACELAPTKEQLMKCEEIPEPTSSTGDGSTSPSGTTTTMPPPSPSSSSSGSGGSATTKPTTESGKTTVASGSSTTSPSTAATVGNTAEISKTTPSTPITEPITEDGNPETPSSGTDNEQSGKSKSQNGRASSSAKNKASSNIKQHSHDDSEEKKLNDDTDSPLWTSKNVQNRSRRSIFRADESDFMCVKLIGTDGDKKVVIRKCAKKSPTMCTVSGLSTVTQCSTCNTDACNSLGISISFGIMSMLLPIATIALFAR